MRSTFKDPFFVLALAFVVLFISLSAVSMTRVKREGQMEVNVTYPKGISLRNMKEGRSLDLRYSSEFELSVYLLTEDQANDLRQPSYFKDPDLPPSLHTGREGSIKIEIERPGTYELMLYNESFTRNVIVDYGLDMGSRIEDVYYRTSLLAVGFITLILVAIVVARSSKRKGRAGRS